MELQLRLYFFFSLIIKNKTIPDKLYSCNLWEEGTEDRIQGLGSELHSSGASLRQGTDKSLKTVPLGLNLDIQLPQSPTVLGLQVHAIMLGLVLQLL